MAISVPVFQEYRDVLLWNQYRKQLNLEDGQIDVIMQFIAAVGKPTNIDYSWRPNLRDEKDNVMVELARTSGSAYVITRNTRDFLLEADLMNDDLRIVTPGEFMNIWRQIHGKE